MEMTLEILFNTVGSLSIFLYGMFRMSESIQKLAGQKLRNIINTMTSNRIMGLGIGATITAVIQSSSITTVMVVGFVNANLMNLRQAIGIILGADIGTTITAFLASLNGSSSARKAAYAHISIKIIGVSIIIPLFFFYVEFISLIASPKEDIIKYIAISHTLFNIFIALLFLPFTTKLEKLINYLVPENKQNLSLEIDDDNLAQTPFIVLEKSKLLIFKMNDIYSQAFHEFGILMSDDSRKCNSCVEKLFEAERQLNEIKIIIINSLTSVLRYSDSNKSVLEVRHYLELADYYESLGDYEASLAKQYLQLKRDNFQFHPHRKKAILKIHFLISKINFEFLDLLKYPDNTKIKNL